MSNLEPLPLIQKIRPQSKVTIITLHGKKMTGRAVMKGSAGWVLNMGGKYGTPAIATNNNIIAVG